MGLKSENKDQLVDILTYHVLGSEVKSTDLQFFQRVPTVEGKNVHVYAIPKLGVYVSPDGKDFKKVVAADNLATNGVAHIIDGVLLPPAALTTQADPSVNIVELAQSVPTLSTLVAAVVAGDLVDTLSSPGPFTVFAPTNDAFGALPEGTLDSLLKPENKDQLVDILTYHVLPAQVLSTDLKFFQSVATVEGKNVHVVRTSKGVYVGPSTKELKTVVAGDLAETLSSPGPFTVFAPTNEAFGALPEGTLDSLLKPENKDQLVDILTYHVLPAQVLSTDLKF